jgi:hypothetical protein
MFRIQTKALVAVVVLFSVTACTNRDREIAQRESDGTDTFKFQAPEKPAVNAPIKPAPKQKEESDSDGTDTFKFKPDPRHFPKQKSEPGT